MKNLALAKKLEGYIINLPDDYDLRILTTSNPPKMREFSNAVVHGIEGVRTSGGRKSLNVMHIMGVFIMIISKMVQNNWSRPDILAALDLVPKYLEIMLSDARIQQEAIMFFDGETESIKKRLR